MKVFWKALSVVWQILGAIISLAVIGLVRVAINGGYWVETVAVTAVILVGIGLTWLARAYMEKRSNSDKNPNDKSKLAVDAGVGVIVNRGIVVFAVLAIIGGMFYWFQVRPSNIRKECTTEASDKMTQLYSNQRTYAQFTAYYEKCLHSRGLE